MCLNSPNKLAMRNLEDARFYLMTLFDVRRNCLSQSSDGCLLKRMNVAIDRVVFYSTSAFSLNVALTMAVVSNVS